MEGVEEEMGMEELKEGNLVLWKRPMADLLCVVQEIHGDQVAVYYMHQPRSEPPVFVNRGEIVKLAESQEREPPIDLLEAVRKQREIHYPPPRRRKKKLMDKGLL